MNRWCQILKTDEKILTIIVYFAIFLSLSWLLVKSFKQNLKQNFKLTLNASKCVLDNEEVLANETLGESLPLKDNLRVYEGKDFAEIRMLSITAKLFTSFSSNFIDKLSRFKCEFLILFVSSTKGFVYSMVAFGLMYVRIAWTVSTFSDPTGDQLSRAWLSALLTKEPHV